VFRSFDKDWVQQKGPKGHIPVNSSSIVTDAHAFLLYNMQVVGPVWILQTLQGGIPMHSRNVFTDIHTVMCISCYMQVFGPEWVLNKG
jgi:hypothetical protein